LSYSAFGTWVRFAEGKMEDSVNNVNDRIAAYEQAVASGKSEFAAGRFVAAFRDFERAHVLGQPDFWRHWPVHLWMLRVAWRRRNRREIVGQLQRLALTPLGHLTGRLPLGNTGGANVSAFKPMSLPEDLARYFRK
jgi:hypothetical protein